MTILTLEHPVVSPQQWLEARKAFLQKEKDFTRQRDELSRLRRQLPWVKVEKPYTFEAPEGKQSLSDLFQERSQLMIYHFMLGPGWPEGCKGCSFMADHFDGILIHLTHRDVTLTAVSRAPLAEIRAFKTRMGWHFPWVSSDGSDFNFDFHVSFTPEQVASGSIDYNYARTNFATDEMPGLSAFYKNDTGEIFHTYSTYARGLDIFVDTYNFLDHAPKGRDEDDLPSPMAWLRHHDRYEDVQPATSCCSHEENHP